MDLSVVLVTYNSSATIAETLDSVSRYVSHIEHEVIVLDNNSLDGTKEILRSWEDRVRVIFLPKNVGFGAANNLGVTQAKGDCVLLLNPDVCVSGETKIGSLITLVRGDARIGLVSPRLMNADGSLQESARRWPTPLVQTIRGCRLEGLFGRFRWYRERMRLMTESSKPYDVDWVIGAFMLMRRSTFMALGGFDERFFVYYEDVDLCLRIHRESLRILYVPWAEAIHHYKRESARSPFSRTRLIHIQSIFRFYRKHGMSYR